METNQNEKELTKQYKKRVRLARSRRIDSELAKLRGIAQFDQFTESILDKIETELDKVKG